MSFSLGIVLVLIYSLVFIRTLDREFPAKPPTQSWLDWRSHHRKGVGLGNPLLNLGSGRDLLTSYVGRLLRNYFRAKSDRPTALASADFDEDGTLIWSPALLVHRAAFLQSIVAMSMPSIPQSRSKTTKTEGSFTEAPFIAPTLVLELPEVPDFVATGDLDADGHWDLAMAAKAGNSLYLLSGDGRGNFSSPETIDLPGGVSAFAAGEINRADGLTDIAVAIVTEQGGQVLVFEGPRGIEIPPESFSFRRRRRTGNGQK